MTESPPSDTPALVQTLWDIEQIKQLKSRYFRAVDGRDWDLFRSLFAPGATFDMDGLSDEARTSIDAFVARADSLLEPGVSVHQGHMPEISVDGDTASGIWSMFDYVEQRNADGTIRRVIHGYGHYHETYRRLPDRGWVIATWKLTRIRVDVV